MIYLYLLVCHVRINKTYGLNSNSTLFYITMVIILIVYYEDEDDDDIFGDWI
jgi:hypothetical protein